MPRFALQTPPLITGEITELYLGKENTDVGQKRRRYLCEFVQGDERRQNRKPSRMGG